jgi:hypothetical protein
MAYLNIYKDLTREGRKLPVGKVLIFDYEGSPIYLKIMRKEKGKILAKRLDPDKFLLPEEADEKVMVVPKT